MPKYKAEVTTPSCCSVESDLFSIEFEADNEDEAYEIARTEVNKHINITLEEVENEEDESN